MTLYETITRHESFPPSGNPAHKTLSSITAFCFEYACLHSAILDIGT